MRMKFPEFTDLMGYDLYLYVLYQLCCSYMFCMVKNHGMHYAVPVTYITYRCVTYGVESEIMENTVELVSSCRLCPLFIGL